MGKSSRGGGSRPPKQGGGQVKARQRDAKCYDGDLLAKQRDKIPLMGNDEDGGTEEEIDMPVLDIPEDTSGSEEEGEEEEEEEYDEEKLTGTAAKLAKQVKLLRQKQAAMAGEEEEGDTREKKAWGKSKKSFYSAENVDSELQSSDDDALAEEDEAEVLRMQRKFAASLRSEDFGLDEEESLEQAVKREGEKGKKKKKAKKAKDSEQGKQVKQAVGSEMAVERIVKDVSLLSKEEQMEVVMSDAPELLGLLDELKGSLEELEQKIIPLEERVRSGGLPTKDGLSYLEVKHLLLLSYCQAIVFYLLLKAEGRSVRDHPVISRLVELRLFMEKMRPLDKKLEYQVEKLLKSTELSNGSEGVKDKDALKYRPNPSLLVPKVDTHTQEAGGVYRPPMIAPTAMKEDMRPADKRSRDRAEKEALRRSARNSFLKELADDLEGRPEELSLAPALVGAENNELKREREKLEARARQEEDLFARVPLSKAERTKLKHMKRSRSGLMGMFDDFNDDVADLVEMEDGKERKGVGGPPDDLLRPRKLSQIVSETGRAAKKQRVASRDAVLSAKDDTGGRRNTHDIQKGARKQVARRKGGRA